MNQKILNIIFIVVIAVLFGVIGYSNFFNKPELAVQQPINTNTPAQTPKNENLAPSEKNWVVYTDMEYGFRIEVPQSSSLGVTSDGGRELGVLNIDVWDSKGLDFQAYIANWGISKADFEKIFIPYTNSRGFKYFKEGITERSQYMQRYFFPRSGAGNYIIVLSFSRDKLFSIGENNIQKIINGVDLNIANKFEITE